MNKLVTSKSNLVFGFAFLQISDAQVSTRDPGPNRVIFAVS